MAHTYRIYRVEKPSRPPDTILWPGGRAGSDANHADVYASTFDAALRTAHERGDLGGVEDGDTLVVLNTSEMGGLAIFNAVKPPAPKLSFQRA